MAEDQEIYVLDEASMVPRWLTYKVDSGVMTQAQATRFWTDYASGGTKFLANHLALFDDAVLLRKLANDLGTPLAKVIFKSYGGKMHVIFKSHPGLRKTLTGTRYGVTSAKVVSLAIGAKGVRQVTRKGGILSNIFVTVWNIAEFVLKDDVTLGQFIGQLSTDIAKIAASTAVGALVGGKLAGAAAAGGMISGFALGPLFVAVVVGFGVAWVLNALDDHFGWTKKLQSFLDQKIAQMNAKLPGIRDDAKLMAIRNVADLLDDVVDLDTENARGRAKREVDRYFPNLPSLPSHPSFPRVPLPWLK